MSILDDIGDAVDYVAPLVEDVGDAVGDVTQDIGRVGPGDILDGLAHGDGDALGVRAPRPTWASGRSRESGTSWSMRCRGPGGTQAMWRSPTSMPIPMS